MLSNSVNQIKQDLSRTRKAIVALGCSFVQGAELAPTEPSNADLNEYKNSRTFINRLCEVYFKKEYTPINFGQEAAGNFSAISRLFLYDIPWKSLDEIIVIFMPTGMQRFDIIKDDNSSMLGQDFKTLWPFVERKKGNEFVDFNVGYENTTYSEKFEVLNFALNFQFLKSWISEHNAKFIIFPAFSREYNKDYFLKTLRLNVYRNESFKRWNVRSDKVPHYNSEYLVEQISWEKFITIDGSINFFDFCYKNDPRYNPNISMLELLDPNNASYLLNNDWIMPRGHPSERGHDLLARKLFEKITAV